MQHGMHFSIDTMVNESLVPRARNNLVSKFLANKEATHLMFIDADIAWQPDHVLAMLLQNKPVICGAYPMKGMPIRYVLNTVQNGATEDSLAEVYTSGTGFMLIERLVIERLIAAMPETKYRDNLNLGAKFEPYMYALFDTIIDEEGNYLSEDWTFCKRVREKLNEKIWVDTAIKLDHIGSYRFAGDTNSLAQIIKGKCTDAK